MTFIPRALVAATALVAAALSPAVASAEVLPPVVLSQPIADPISADRPGTGLCGASAISSDIQKDFAQLNSSNYVSGMNTFIDDHAMDRVELVIRTLLDLSNNNDTGAQNKPSYGDFIDAMTPTCKTGGCNFFVNDTTTSFGSRLRGFMNVSDALVGKPLHFGFYADDAVSMSFFDSTAKQFPVVIRPPQLGAPTWRTTNTVTFQAPGLYAVEILYIEIVEHAALELAIFDGTFNDFESPVTVVGSPNLEKSGFKLMEPKVFYHTLAGTPSFPDVNACQQCNRQFVGQAGNGGCVPGYYCNEAALCAPCDTAALCGPSCSPCGGDTPFCLNINGQQQCGGCRNDFDCKEGFSCNLDTHECNQCNEPSDCPRGETCEDHVCVPCSKPDTCAGVSCNCCPNGSNGQQMDCQPHPEDGTFVCMECLTGAECKSGQCDILTGHCVDEIKPNASPNCCGESCVTCPADFPFCLPGPVGTACAQCRHDMDCGDGKFCLSGACSECVRDKRCGLRCESCFGDTPYCMGQIAEVAECVRCTTDAQCNGSTCNPKTNQCEPGCAMPCPAGTPYCDGQKCVECYADTQCPCGGTCDLSTNTCDPSCKTNADCLGNEHCRWAENEKDKECALGPMPGDVACGGTLATACEGSIAGGGNRRDENTPPAVALVGLTLLALLGRRRMRGIS
jgi:outer membrane exchange protein TraA